MKYVFEATCILLRRQTSLQGQFSNKNDEADGWHLIFTVCSNGWIAAATPVLNT